MERITIDPREFISGPFRKCPKCGAEQFGVLMVSGNLYVRRCRERAWRVADRLTDAQNLGAASLVVFKGAVFDFPSRFSALRLRIVNCQL
jgi:hypothetical protein